MRAVRITVTGGTVSAVVFVDDGQPPQSAIETFPTIDDLFDEIRAAIDGGADSVSAMYDATAGHPTRVDIDYIREAIDDEMTFTVSELTPVGPTA